MGHLKWLLSIIGLVSCCLISISLAYRSPTSSPTNWTQFFEHYGHKLDGKPKKRLSSYRSQWEDEYEGLLDPSEDDTWSENRRDSYKGADLGLDSEYSDDGDENDYAVESYDGRGARRGSYKMPKVTMPRIPARPVTVRAPPARVTAARVPAARAPAARVPAARAPPQRVPHPPQYNPPRWPQPPQYTPPRGPPSPQFSPPRMPPPPYYQPPRGPPPPLAPPAPPRVPPPKAAPPKTAPAKDLPAKTATIKPVAVKPTVPNDPSKSSKVVESQPSQGQQPDKSAMKQVVDTLEDTERGVDSVKNIVDDIDSIVKKIQGDNRETPQGPVGQATSPWIGQPPWHPSYGFLVGGLPPPYPPGPPFHVQPGDPLTPTTTLQPNNSTGEDEKTDAPKSSRRLYDSYYKIGRRRSAAKPRCLGRSLQPDYLEYL